MKHVDNQDFISSVSNHSRWAAVDVTTVKLLDSKEIEMPTQFDNLSERAYPDYTKLSKKVIDNRDMLIWLMESYWFRVYSHEWWYFDYVNLLDLDPLDIEV